MILYYAACLICGHILCKGVECKAVEVICSKCGQKFSVEIKDEIVSIRVVKKAEKLGGFSVSKVGK